MSDDKERALYGVPLASLHVFMAEKVGPGKMFATRAEAAFAILSDAQELLDGQAPAMARQAINRAKWLLKGGDRRTGDSPDPIAVDRRGGS